MHNEHAHEFEDKCESAAFRRVPSEAIDAHSLWMRAEFGLALTRFANQVELLTVLADRLA